MTPTAPLRLRADLEQATPNEVFRLALIDDEFTLQAGIAGGWEDIYRFGLLPQLPIDYEAINWHTATRPNALFVENLRRHPTDARCPPDAVQSPVQRAAAGR